MLTWQKEKIHKDNTENNGGGKRPLRGLGVSNKGMKFWKRLLHKMERKQGKKEIDDVN